MADLEFVFEENGEVQTRKWSVDNTDSRDVTSHHSDPYTARETVPEQVQNQEKRFGGIWGAFLGWLGLGKN